MAGILSYADLNTFYTSTGRAILKNEYESLFFKRNPFFKAIRANGGFNTQEATGTKITMNVGINQNDTFGWRSPDDLIPINEQDPLRTLEFPWASASASLAVFDSKVKLNQGKAQIINYLEAVTKQLAATMYNQVATAWSDGTSADSPYKMLGLKDGVANATYIHPVNYGGVPSTGDYVNWASTMIPSTGAANLVSDLGNLVNSIWVNGFTGGLEDLWLWTDQATYQLLESKYVTQIQTMDLKVGDGSFKALNFRGRPVMFDALVTPIPSDPDGSGTAWTGTLDTGSTHRVYAIAPKTWQFVSVPGWGLDDLMDGEWIRPNNQQMRSKLSTLMLNCICAKRRENGALINVPLS